MSDANSPNTPTIPAQSSNFTYEPPKSEATPDELAEFNDLLNGSIKDIADEYRPQFEDEAPESTEPQETTEEAQPNQAPEGHQNEQEKESPEVARGLERLVQRELAVQEKERAFAARESRVGALEAEVTKLRAATPQADLLKKFDTSPSDALKAMGKDPATVVRLMIAEQLAARGEQVPEGLKQFVERAANDRRISELEAQIAARDKAAQEAQVFSAVQAGAREYVKTIDGKKMPSLATAFKTDPEFVHETIMEEIDRLAAKRPDVALTYADAADAAEKRLARIAKALTAPAASTPPKSLAEGQNKSTPPATKAPVRPLKPWEQRNTTLDDAIKEASRTFYQEEAKQRGARL